MVKLFCITVNPKKDVKQSKGLQIGEVFLEEFKKIRPDAAREMAKETIPAF